MTLNDVDFRGPRSHDDGVTEKGESAAGVHNTLENKTEHNFIPFLTLVWLRPSLAPGAPRQGVVPELALGVVGDGDGQGGGARVEHQFRRL